MPLRASKKNDGELLDVIEGSAFKSTFIDDGSPTDTATLTDMATNWVDWEDNPDVLEAEVEACVQKIVGQVHKDDACNSNANVAPSGIMANGEKITSEDFNNSLDVLHAYVESKNLDEEYVWKIADLECYLRNESAKKRYIKCTKVTAITDYFNHK